MNVPSKTVRFTEVVRQCGKPTPLTFWSDPAHDASFQHAWKQHQVATVKQSTVGSRKDFAVVGFYQEPHVSYWLFPKSLRQFEGKRIIGIDYSALAGLPTLAAPELKPPRARNRREQAHRERDNRAAEKSAQPSEGFRAGASAVPAGRPPRRTKPPFPAPKPVPPRFRVTLRCVAEVLITREVEATSRRKAGEQALNAAQSESIDFGESKRSWKIVRTERLPFPGRAARRSATADG